MARTTQKPKASLPPSDVLQKPSGKHILKRKKKDQHLVAAARFKRMVKVINKHINPSWKFSYQTKALQLIQTVYERYLKEVSFLANVLAVGKGRLSITPVDLLTAAIMRYERYLPPTRELQRYTAKHNIVFDQASLAAKKRKDNRRKLRQNEQRRVHRQKVKEEKEKEEEETARKLKEEEEAIAAAKTKKAKKPKKETQK